MNWAAYGKIVDKVDHTDEFSSVCVDESFVPAVDVLVLDLNGVGKSHRAIVAGKVRDRLVAVELSIELLLDIGDDVLYSNAGSRVGDVS